LNKPKQLILPSSLSKDKFIKMFGGIFEHSEWIAEQTWEKGLNFKHDKASGLHSLMVSIFRKANEVSKIEVLKSHPDLAGRLMVNKGLTKESTKEQASAGLDSLNELEQTFFKSLNKSYKQKHQFPFIIAAKGLSSDLILEAFRNRVNNSTDSEFVEACVQVEKIAYLRLIDILK
jgi:OHCU decarboxylase